VSAEAGEPYRDRLLALPPFLLGRSDAAVTAEHLRAGFALTGHFLEARVLRPRDMRMPEARSRLLSYVGRGSTG
jgi:DNA repair protein RecO (recombination protein O)